MSRITRALEKLTSLRDFLIQLSELGAVDSETNWKGVPRRLYKPRYTRVQGKMAEIDRLCALESEIEGLNQNLCIPDLFLLFCNSKDVSSYIWLRDKTPSFRDGLEKKLREYLRLSTEPQSLNYRHPSSKLERLMGTKWLWYTIQVTLIDPEYREESMRMLDSEWRKPSFNGIDLGPLFHKNLSERLYEEVFRDDPFRVGFKDIEDTVYRPLSDQVR